MNAKRMIRVAAKTVFALADPFFGAFPGPRILIYHQVGVSLGREMEISSDAFRRQLDWMQRHGEIVSLDGAITRRGEQDAQSYFCLTFDDGFEDVYHNAFPLLMERGIPFSLYLTTRPVETGEPLDARYPDALPLTWDQVNRMVDSGLVTLGAHTHTHPHLHSLSAEAVVDELDTSNQLIEERTGQRPRHFTYPWGEWSPAVDHLVRQRYDSATVGGGGPLLDNSDLHRLPRIPIQKSDTMVFFGRKLRSGLRLEDATRRRLRRARLPVQSSESAQILFLIDSLEPGGAERSLVELVPALCDAAIRPVVVCLKSGRNSLAGEARSAGAEVMTLRSNGWVGRIVEARRLLRQRHPLLVHTTLWEANIVGRIAAAGTGIPVATSLVNMPYDPARLADRNVQPWKLHLVQLVDRWTARHLVDRFHAITEAVKAAAVRDLHIAPTAITVIPRSRNRRRLGEPSPERRREVRAALGLRDDALVLLNIGRQEYQKGQRHLLNALAELKKERPDMVALIAGKEGNATRELEALHTELALGDSVRFLGHREDIGDLLSAADLFVFPSLYEGLGGALLEAMAMGLPIVASNLPAIVEVLGEAEDSTLVTPGDVRSLIEGVRIAARRDRPHRSKSLRSHFEQDFSERRVVVKTIEWLNGSARSRRSWLHGRRHSES